MRVIQGSYDGKGLRIGIVVSRANELPTRQLLVGALDGLRRHGVDKDAITVVYVPGAGELALACRRLAGRGTFEALIALGVELRDASPAADAITGAASAIATAALDAGVPIIWGFLVAPSLAEALEQAGGRSRNRGFEAALAAIESARVLQEIDE